MLTLLVSGLAFVENCGIEELSVSPPMVLSLRKKIMKQPMPQSGRSTSLWGYLCRKICYDSNLSALARNAKIQARKAIEFACIAIYNNNTEAEGRNRAAARQLKERGARPWPKAA